MRISDWCSDLCSSDLAAVINVVPNASRMQPCADTFAIVLALPDRHPCLDFIDHPAARRECRVAMAGADPDPDREIAQRQCADPVHRLGIDDIEEIGRASLRERVCQYV